MEDKCPYIGSIYLEEFKYFTGPHAEIKEKEGIRKAKLVFDGDNHHLKVIGDEEELLHKLYGPRGVHHSELSSIRSLGHAIQARAKKDPSQKVYRWLDDKYNETVSYTPLEMERYAKDVASKLTNKYGLVPGDRVALAFLPSPEFVIAFFACAMGGKLRDPVCHCVHYTQSILHY